ncbi:MAG: hypothetical protein EZS28_004610 [Streblomastix strix]|uniref:protein-tyrosine-phosphatase n=1 Tax=Streblomastix strix TaxID=222440 RepID=A0A5J4X085_9EUKA|nr:MAG: hypothetical protein EZS28_004610 [Streblomastix strix]
MATEKEPDVSKITESIFVGSQQAAASKQVLQKYGIKRILRLRSLSSPKLGSEFVPVVSFIQVEDLSSSNITSCLGPSFAAIQEALDAGQRILIHCHAGKSRSPAIVIAFLMRHHHVPLSVAYRHVERERHGLAMNPTFKRQLSDYENQLFGRRSMRYCVFCGDFDCSCLKFNLLQCVFREQVKFSIKLIANEYNANYRAAGGQLVSKFSTPEMDQQLAKKSSIPGLRPDFAEIMEYISNITREGRQLVYDQLRYEILRVQMEESERKKRLEQFDKIFVCKCRRRRAKRLAEKAAAEAKAKAQADGSAGTATEVVNTGAPSPLEQNAQQQQQQPVVEQVKQETTTSTQPTSSSTSTQPQVDGATQASGSPQQTQQQQQQEDEDSSDSDEDDDEYIDDDEDDKEDECGWCWEYENWDIHAMLNGITEKSPYSRIVRIPAYYDVSSISAAPLEDEAKEEEKKEDEQDKEKDKEKDKETEGQEGEQEEGEEEGEEDEEFDEDDDENYEMIEACNSRFVMLMHDRNHLERFFRAASFRAFKENLDMVRRCMI